jgi:hypothetical protein
MARYKSVDMSPQPLPVNLETQLVPDSFAHGLCHLVDATVTPTQARWSVLSVCATKPAANRRPGHEVEAPMAITVLGGLLTSSILTRGVLPAVARRLSSSSVSGPA